MRSYLWCNFIKSEEGESWLHEACFMRWVIMNIYGYWRWPVSSCIRHTYYQISTTVQIFLIDQNTRKQLAKLHQLIFSQSYTVEKGDGVWAIIWVDVDIENLHACIYIFFKNMYPLGLHVLGVTSTLFNALHEWRKSTVAL